jgi:glycosyltransferase involved in cell wall biosynthesis
MKILVIAMPFSIHTVRWISHINTLEHEIHVFSSYAYSNPHVELKNVIFHDYYHSITNFDRDIIFSPIWRFEVKSSNILIKKIIGKLFRILRLEQNREKTLLKVIKSIRPDIIHSMETQNAGYLVSNIKTSLSKFPFWIHSNWGIDMHYYGEMDTHRRKIIKCLEGVDVLLVEGNRDKVLANKYGFKQDVLIFPSVGGGFEIPNKDNIITELPSKRKTILIKGTQDNVRRGLNSLLALQQCADFVKGYKIVLYQCSELLFEKVSFLISECDMDITIVDELSHLEMIELNKIARISITNNLSDGLPNSMLEAMLFGAFPIQSNTSCADDWIINGINGILVSPEDIDEIRLAIKESLINDELVDNAALINFLKIKNSLESNIIKNKIAELYMFKQNK